MTTQDGSAFEVREPRPDGKDDSVFNQSGKREDPHGHVVSREEADTMSSKYYYVRDVDGYVFVDRLN